HSSLLNMVHIGMAGKHKPAGSTRTRIRVNGQKSELIGFGFGVRVTLDTTGPGLGSLTPAPETTPG
ncbi:hypothetical protein A2U01_0076431, partial [Trifolium medium]|nr:hypothetical protein [Trifolium medium]